MAGTLRQRKSTSSAAKPVLRHEADREDQWSDLKSPRAVDLLQCLGFLYVDIFIEKVQPLIVIISFNRLMARRISIPRAGLKAGIKKFILQA